MTRDSWRDLEEEEEEESANHSGWHPVGHMTLVFIMIMSKIVL